MVEIADCSKFLFIDCIHLYLFHSHARPPARARAWVCVRACVRACVCVCLCIVAGRRELGGGGAGGGAERGGGVLECIV